MSRGYTEDIKKKVEEEECILCAVAVQTKQRYKSPTDHDASIV